MDKMSFVGDPVYTRMCARGPGHLRRIAQVFPGSNAVTHLRDSHDALIAGRSFVPRHINQ